MCLFCMDVDWLTLQMVPQSLGKWNQRTSSPAAAGGDEEIAPPTVKFLPYADRLSSEAHLWADKRADTSTMEDIQCAQINPSAAPATYLHPHPYLHELHHLLLCFRAYILSLPHACSILLSFQPPHHLCTAASQNLREQPTRPPLVMNRLSTQGPSLYLQRYNILKECSKQLNKHFIMS